MSLIGLIIRDFKDWKWAILNQTAEINKNPVLNSMAFEFHFIKITKMIMISYMEMILNTLLPLIADCQHDSLQWLVVASEHPHDGLSVPVRGPILFHHSEVIAL